MSMDSNNDPFSSTLSFESPQIFDSETVGPVHEDGLEFFDAALPQDSPGQLFEDDSLASSPYQSQFHSKPNGQASLRRTLPGPAFAASPESSLQDSSSDSSDQHHRKISSNSSRSVFRGFGSVLKENAQIKEWKNEDSIMTDPGSNYCLSGPIASEDANFDLINRAMEHDFDFESAATSPSQQPVTPTTAQNGPRYISIPYRTSPRPATSQVPSGRPVPTAQEVSPLSNVMLSRVSNNNPESFQSPTRCDEDYVNGVLLNGIRPSSAWSYSSQPIDSSPGGNSINPPPQVSVVSRPRPSAYQPSYGVAQSPTLMIHPIPSKSRVETQIPIKLTLFPMPIQVTKLHLPAHTISKPKLLAKPTPQKSPEMLELDTMLVCTSAVQDPEKLQRAFGRAAHPASIKRETPRRFSSGDTIPTDEENNPLDGDRVKICPGCIVRERKRAARKKSKKPEEEELWQKDEAERIIVFNTSEVKDWQPPSLPSLEKTPADPNSLSMISDYAGQIPFVPNGALQIDLPMRIACYCRHVHEKIGFQVIFTIKNFEGKLVAQAITNSILITDDHKTHVPPTSIHPTSTGLAENISLPGAGILRREPIENYGPAPFRHAHSTTDLLGLQRNPNPHLVQQNIRPFATPMNSSQATSTTLTPHGVSRQASPIAHSGPVHKKRKAGGSGKVPEELTMTRLETLQDPTGANQSWSSTAPSNGTSSAGASPYTPNYPPYSTPFSGPVNGAYNGHVSRPAQLHTGPPTPTSNENGFNFGNRSQSMENLSAVQQLFSAPSSAHPSRVPSPIANSISHSHIGNMQQSHAQALRNSLYGVPNSLNASRSPTIHKLIPKEGTKAGGIEVTCLGSGFYNGLEVMFGDALATTTTYWGDTSLVCLLPPAVHAGRVPVTFKHQYQQQMQAQRYPSPPLPKQHVYFTYVDDEEQNAMKLALIVLSQKMTGTIEDADDIARRIINGNQSSGAGTWNASNSQSTGQQRQVPSFHALLAQSTDMETALLKCLDLIDLDDSPFRACLDLQGANGQSMLHLCASLGYHRLVAGLLARGANPDVRDRNGMSPMHMAALNGRSQIIRRLRLARGDPTLRSLRGYTPADMAPSRELFEAVSELHHSRSRSAGTVANLSRDNSIASLKSFWNGPAVGYTADQESLSSMSSREDASEDEGLNMQARQSVTAAQLWARSRRNSVVLEQNLMTERTSEELRAAGFPSPAAAMSAWRDQLAAQIQHFQQSVNWTLPTLPPMPNLPDYQMYPMVRRISSLVPQRSPRLETNPDQSGGTKENDYRWWELLTGVTSSPPAYEDIYPEENRSDVDDKKIPAVRAVVDTFLDNKCAANFDQTTTGSSAAVETTTLGRQPLAKQRQEQLRTAHARKVKRLRSDRNLFFFWIPLLILLLVVMLKDRVPVILEIAPQAFEHCRTHYLGRAAEVL